MERASSPERRRAKSESRIGTERVFIGPRRRRIAIARTFAMLAFMAISAYVAANLYGYAPPLPFQP